MERMRRMLTRQEIEPMEKRPVRMTFLRMSVLRPQTMGMGRSRIKMSETTFKAAFAV
jgi:hypothetical protein